MMGSSNSWGLAYMVVSILKIRGSCLRFYTLLLQIHYNATDDG